MTKHKMVASGPVINGEPNIIHDDDFEPPKEGMDNTEQNDHEEPNPEDR